MLEEMGAEMDALKAGLERVGLSVDPFVGNFTKDEAGNVYYLEAFIPWELNPNDENNLRLLFNEEKLRSAIEGIPDRKIKAKCESYLKRLLEAMEEEDLERRIKG